MSLVDPYHDRVFRNGRLYGVNYDEQTMRPTYSDISPFGGGRKAGEGIGLEPDVVIYMGKAAQGMPQDQGMDVRIAEGMLKAMSRAIEPQLRTMEFVPSRDTAESRTLEYVPSRDGPPNIEPLGPYNPDTDESRIEPIGPASSRRMSPGEVREFLEPLEGMNFGGELLGEISHGGSTPYKPMDSESMKRLREPGSPMPKDVRDEILRNLAGMRKA